MSRASCNPLPVAALAVALAGLAPGSPVTADARAGTIQRCAATDGTTLYTDKPCAAFGATPLPMPGELAMRISSDGGSDALGRAPGHVDAALPRQVARRSPASGCARSPTQLAMDLQGAFALGDVNRIAESWHWVGLGHQAAMPVMQRLERMAMSTLVDARFFDASIGGGHATWASADASLDAAGGILQLTLGGEGGYQVLDLQVQPYAGCYFVRF